MAPCSFVSLPARRALGHMPLSARFPFFSLANGAESCPITDNLSTYDTISHGTKNSINLIIFEK
ncbi:hypothetical protein J6590_047047 [Homalodisca vitripennis]|nr:hypothetical protein J6590_047047 [Homalodisca vitripennis]